MKQKDYHKDILINGAVTRCYPLCAAQRLHYNTVRTGSKAQVLNIGTGLYIKLDVDFNMLKGAIKQAIMHMDSARLRFTQDEDGNVYQYIVPTDDRDIRLYDFSDKTEEECNDIFRSWTCEPMNIYNSCLNLINMIKMPDGYNGIYMKVNHLTMDSSSVIAFYTDILETYSNMVYGYDAPKPMIPYIEQLQKDLAYEDNSEQQKKDEEFFISLYKDRPEGIYTDFAGMGRLLTQRRETGNPNLRDVLLNCGDTTAAISVFQLEKEATDKLMSFCEENRIPFVQLIMMAMRTVLSKFNDNEKDVSIKTVVARRGTLSEKKSGGTRVHFYPVRTIIEPETPFMEAIKMIQAEQSRIFRHANYDPVKVLGMTSEYGNARPYGTYDCMSITYQPMSLRAKNTKLPDIPYKSAWYTNGVAAQPLYLTIMHRPEDGGLNFNFEYQVEEVTHKEMEFFYYYLCRVLFCAAENKDRTVGEILELI